MAVTPSSPRANRPANPYPEFAWDAAWAFSLQSHRAGDLLGQPFLLLHPIPDWHAPWWLALDCRDNSHCAVLEAGPARSRIHPLLDTDLYLLPTLWPTGEHPRLLTLPLPDAPKLVGFAALTETQTSQNGASGAPLPPPAQLTLDALSLLPHPLESRLPSYRAGGLPAAAVWQLLAPLVQRLSRALATGVRTSLEDFLQFTLPTLSPGYLMLAPHEPRLQLIGWTATDLALASSPGLFACLPPEWSVSQPTIESVLGPSATSSAARPAIRTGTTQGTPAGATGDTPAPEAPDANPGEEPVGEYIKQLRRIAAQQAGYALAATALWLVRGQPPFADRKDQSAGWAFRAVQKTRPVTLPRKLFEDTPQFARLLKQLLNPVSAQRGLPEPEALGKSWEQAAPPGDALVKLRACMHCGSLKHPGEGPCWLCGRDPYSGNLAPSLSARTDSPGNLGSGRRRTRTARVILTPPGIRFHCSACHAPLHAADARAGALGRCPVCSAFNEIPRTSNRATGPGHEVYLDPPVHPDPETAPRIYVPAGPFAVGVDAISVILPAFVIDAHPVTNAQYAKFFQHFKGGRNRGQPRVAFPPHIEDILDSEKALLPVIGLTYAQAEYYAQAHGGRIPSALEWERCARGPEGRRYPWGDEFNPLYCNHRRYCNAVAQLGADPGHLPVITEPRLLPVGAIERDAGFSNFRDPAGNAAEWTSNRREIYDGRVALREIRGGAFVDGAEFLLETWANMWQPESQPENWLSFRVAYDAT